MGKLGDALSKVPVVGNIAKAVVKKVRYNNKNFQGSKNYWEERYAKGGDSGYGSYSKFAEFKAEYINKIIKENNLSTVLEFGCGDGNQLTLAEYPHYIGLDVSSTIIDLCNEKFSEDKAKEFQVYDSFTYDKSIKCDISMSLDVIYHLVEEEVYNKYMEHLFSGSDKFVIIYSSNEYREQTFHEKHRKFTDWIKTNATDWKLIDRTENIYKLEAEMEKDTLDTSHADFFIYRK
jgi:cyclopropane fatty-acyl-phospholipid synthase-like methyltransferase